MQAYFQPQAFQAPTAIIASFSNGRVYHGLDPSAPMIPNNMLPPQQFISQTQPLLAVLSQQDLMQMVAAQPHVFSSPSPMHVQHQSMSHQGMSYQSPSISPRHQSVPPQQPAMFYQHQSISHQDQTMPVQYPSMLPQQETFATEQVSKSVQHPHEAEQQPTEQVFFREAPTHARMTDDPQIEECEYEVKVESQLERNLQLFRNSVDRLQELRGIWREHSLEFDQFIEALNHLFYISFETDKVINEAGSAWAQRINTPFTQSYGTTKAFLQFFDEALNIMQDEGSNANLEDLKQLGDDMIATFQAYVDFMLRPDFDTKGELEVFGSDGWSGLTSAVRAFKKEQLFTQGLSCLQTQQSLDYKQIQAIQLFLTVLKSEYAFWEQNTTANRLIVWIQVAWEQIQLVKRELKMCIKKDPARQVNPNWKKDPSRRNKVAQNRNVDKRIEHVVHACRKCLKFLKSDSFDNKGETEFNGYESTRSLQIYCLKFKFMSLPGFCEQKLNTRDKNDRGIGAVRHRAKRLCSLGAQAYKMGEFWKQMVETGAVDFEGAYMVLDHKSDDQNKEGSRKLQGILLYFILSTEKDSRNFLKLMVAFSETKHRRDQVLRHFGDLYELQRDNLSPLEDEKRAKLRQNMLRKTNSMMPEKQFESFRVWDKKTGAYKEKKREIKPTAQEVRDHAEKDAKIRDVLCADGEWSDEDLKHQRRMYHIAPATKEEEEEKEQDTESKQISSPARIQSLRGPCAFMSAGC